MNNYISEDKIDFITNIVELGISFDEAARMAHLSELEKRQMEGDREFQDRLELAKDFEVVKLLKKYKETAEKAANKCHDYNGVRQILIDMYGWNFGRSSDEEHEVRIYNLPDNGR